MNKYNKNKRITTLDGFYEVICNDSLIYWRNKIHSCSDFFSWKIKDLKETIDQGEVFTIIENDLNDE
jgi:hypothetical protein